MIVKYDYSNFEACKIINSIFLKDGKSQSVTIVVP